ncbi:root phototropism protein 2 [Plakobranchus ocellatus]|uniref:Root phototropism protein 2 n=1 Tax=Plakobranchus ocellatus TaxID=259542 RepID=A0AAV4CQK6_9GAST|nr:root phototropism protein 2 [Plakobranchus ocellatus]
MDFAKFRGSGDLSDITVIVRGREHKLHKFPFFARSDYFCELARSKSERELEHITVKLEDFPGGNETFEQVADFCYNMPLDITKENVIALRCAAEYLKMFGPGNLTDKADKYLSNTIASARMVKATTAIVSLLVHCNAVGSMAEQVGLVDMLSEAFVECWRKNSHVTPVSSKVTNNSKAPIHTGGFTSAFTRVSGTVIHIAADKLDEATIDCLTSLPAEWVAKVLTRARAVGISNESLGGLAVRYITCALNPKTKRSDCDVPESTEQCSKEEPDQEKGTESAITPAEATQDVEANKSHSEGDKESVSQDIDLGSVLDKIVLALPEQAFSIPSVTMDWLTKVLRVATAHNCSCRGHLVRVAGEMLTHLGPDDLCVISPSVLHDIVTDSKQIRTGEGQTPDETSTSVGLHGERACKLVDTYMAQMVAKGVLTSETFKMLSSATKNYPRPSHDSLFEVLLFVIKSEKDSLSAEAKNELTELINFDLLSETSLKLALDEDVLPVLTVAESALRLCSRLRSELQSVKFIAEMQEEDIQKYQINAPSKLKSTVTRNAGATSPPSIADSRHFASFAERARMIHTGYAEDGDQEHQDKSVLDDDTLHAEDLSSSPHNLLVQHPHGTSDPLRAAQGVLNAARHKLALPVYTGYRPARYSPTSVGTHLHARRGLENDISLEDELEFKFDRTFRSLDPRVRHQRLGGHGGHVGHRTYFPYSNHAHRF